MSKFAEPMSRLIDELKKLPGVGSKSAQRLAFYILRASDEDAEALAAARGGGVWGAVGSHFIDDPLGQITIEVLHRARG